MISKEAVFLFQKYGTIGKEIDMKTSMVLRPGSAALSNRALTLRLLFSHGALSRTDIDRKSVV